LLIFPENYLLISDLMAAIRLKKRGQIKARKGGGAEEKLLEERVATKIG